MGEQAKHTADLTQSQRFLLGWLDQEDWSALGECQGADLDRLISLGLAEVNGSPPFTGYEGVRLTDEGRAAIAKAEGR